MWSLLSVLINNTMVQCYIASSFSHSNSEPHIHIQNRGIRKMTIFHINCNYMSTALHQIMIRHLNKYVPNNVVFAPVSEKTIVVVEPDKNVIVSKCFKKIDRYFFHYKQNKIYKAVQNNCEIENSKCIYAYTVFTDGNVAYRLSQRLNIPYVVAIRDTDLNLFFKKFFWLRKTGVKILLNANVVLFLSNGYKNQLLRKYIPEKYRELIEQKSRIVPNGIDDFWFDNIGDVSGCLHKAKRIKHRELVLIFVGTICKRKNVSTAIKAASILIQRGWNITFNVVGKMVDNEESNDVEQCEFVHYYKHMNKEKLISIYRSSDLFVMPSYTETFGLTYAEALTQGLPVIYSKDQGFDKQFNDGEVGYSVNPYSTDDIANKIELICQKYDEIAPFCISKAEKFRWDSICKQYQDIFSSVITKEE